MRWNAEQMVPYMWRQPSLICAFMLGESGSMDDWYPTHQLADYLRQTLRDGVGVETERNRYNRCVDSRQERNTAFPCWDAAKKWNQRGEDSFGSVDEWNVKPNLIHLAKRVGTKAFALQPWTWPSSVERGWVREGNLKKKTTNKWQNKGGD